MSGLIKKVKKQYSRLKKILDHLAKTKQKERPQYALQRFPYKNTIEG